MKKTEQYRQGDVFIEQTTAKPKGKPITGKDGKTVLAYGEVTGHMHALQFDEGRLYGGAPAPVLIMRRGAELRHEEHSPVKLKRGKYEITIQREYSPEEIRNVQD